MKGEGEDNDGKESRRGRKDGNSMVEDKTLQAKPRRPPVKGKRGERRQRETMRE